MVHGVRPDELVRLAPRLRSYLHRPNPTWPEIIDAADWLRHDLDVSKSLWGDACFTLGRDLAAVALAVVSTKTPEHFRTTPGATSTAWCRRPRPANCTSNGRCGRCGGPLSRCRRREAGRGGGRDRGDGG
jgi:hypothetical protein